MPDDPDGVPYPQACDALKLAGLEGHAAAHARIPEIEARLERTVAGMERFIRELESPEDPAPAMTLEMIALIASHRGESILATMARLGGHPPRATWTDPAPPMPMDDLRAMVRARRSLGLTVSATGETVDQLRAELDRVDELVRERRVAPR